MGRRRQARRGIALAVVIGSALVFAVAAYAVLYSALGMRSRVSFNTRNLKARYAAEAGMVWGMQQLWVNPGWTSPLGNVDLPFDIDQNGVTDANEGVDIIYETCPAYPCQMQARVVY